MKKIQIFEGKLKAAQRMLRGLNPNIAERRASDIHAVAGKRPHRLQKVLVANRGEIAKRFFLALHEEGIPSVAVVSDVDRDQSWYEFADEVVFIGDRYNYSNIPVIVAAALLVKANAVYPGYGFLSESPEFAEALELVGERLEAGIIFMGPGPRPLRLVGNKLNARQLAREHEIPLFDSSETIGAGDVSRARIEARRIGYPVMVKLISGGGGRGIHPVFDPLALDGAVESCCRIGEELYRDGSFYIEKYIRRPVHVEVQIFNGWALGLRKCAVQRRHQKILEESGHGFFNDYVSLSLMAAAEKLAHVSGYSNGCGAGTVEFLIDGDTGRFGFMEMNTRLQVEYAVTDQSLGIDLAKWQILFFDGREEEISAALPARERLAKKDHSIECRIYAEEPENDGLPSSGTILEMDLPTFNGVRCDFGFGKGDRILPMYDPMIGKIIANGSTRREALIRLERALQEFYIKGVKTNVNQLLRILRNQEFIRGDYTNNLLLEHPDLSFQEAAADEEVCTDRRAVKHLIFAALSEYLKLTNQSVREFMVIANLESVINIPVPRVPHRYVLEYRSQRYAIEIVRTSLAEFYVYVNGTYNGRLTLGSFNESSDDLLVIFGSSSYRILVDRQSGFLILRMRDEGGKLNYYRMSVISEGPDEQENLAVVRSPFQGTLIAFCRSDLRPGAQVKTGEPLLIISSMKMETTLHAPQGGRIISIIGEGDSSKSDAGRNHPDNPAGRSIREGEVLVRIECTEPAERAFAGQAGRERACPYPPGEEAVEMLLREEFVRVVSADPERHMPLILELLRAVTQGFVQQSVLVERLSTLMESIPIETWNRAASPAAIEGFNNAILHNTGVKKLFSPAVFNEGLSFSEELDRFVRNWQNPQLELSDPFEGLLRSLLASYGIEDITGKSAGNPMLFQYVFPLLKRSHEIAQAAPDIVKNCAHIVARQSEISDLTLSSLFRLLEQEQAELDDSLSKFIRKIIVDKYPGLDMRMLTGSASESAAAIIERSLGLDGSSLARLKDECAASLERPTAVPDYTGEGDCYSRWLAGRLSELASNYRLSPLYSPCAENAVFKMESIEEGRFIGYAAFSRVECAPTGPGDVIRDAIQKGAALVAVYDSIRRGEGSFIHVEVLGRAFAWDLSGGADYHALRDLCSSAMAFLTEGSIARGIIECDVDYGAGLPPQRKLIGFTARGDSVARDLLFESDKRNPYFKPERFVAVNQRLFNDNKWPIVCWAHECFDPGSVEEIRIRSIDEARRTSSGEEILGGRAVGATIFHGTIGGLDACFYMKDSRISGGSTGSREGLKYAAAAYISFMKGWPLYVWNDSAGANIMEGVVSLNRGAEGFMMNSLLAENVSAERFLAYVRNTKDEAICELVEELDAQFGFNSVEVPGPEVAARLVAVGIGSSAGLDVYGSSQAAVQILLDSTQSYRVLTGANVIHSVIGEEISNYDIGGAKLLGKWTGIVDLIAHDKLHLLSCVRRLHQFFGPGEALPAIRRRTGNGKEVGNGNGLIVFGESLVRGNVDDGWFWPFKEEYYASEALIGGFARLGGHRTLIMGPRTHSGLGSTATMVKARELLRLARRTSSHKLLIFGKRWRQAGDSGERIRHRSVLDFERELRRQGGVQINVVTHPQGMRCFEVNCTADAIIFVKNDGETEAENALAAGNSHFAVHSLEEAFDLAQRLFSLFNDVSAAGLDSSPGGIPFAPDDPSQPYDIIESIIRPVFDAGSFLEFHRESGDPMSGSHLVTGLARLEGRTVGLIADQPLFKGGGADAPGTEKFRIFTEMLNRRGIPLVMLSNSSGFVPGSTQERFRIQAIGAESLDANILGEIPVVSIVLNQNYGGRLIQAFNRFLRPGIVYLARESAVMAVLGVTAAFDILYGKKYRQLLDEGKKERADELRGGFYRQYLDKARASRDAVSTGVIDWLIDDIRELRGHIVKGLRLAFRRCNEAFGTDWPQ